MRVRVLAVLALAACVALAAGWLGGRADASQAPGDFVRWMKQLIDLLDQVSDAAPEGSPVRATATRAVSALRRGVVAYSAVA